MNTIKENILNQSNYAQRKFKHCKIIGEDNRRRILYKYMNLESAIKCIKNKVLCFVEPTCWKDQYEKLFYTANYSKVDTCEKFPLTLFASCFTKNQTSEACWSVYVHEKARIASHCVQFRINRKFFRKELNQCMQKYHGTVYEGQCNYSLHDAQINPVHGRWFRQAQPPRRLSLSKAPAARAAGTEEHQKVMPRKRG